MLRIKSRLSTFELDPQRYAKSLDEAISTQQRQAARAWLRAVIEKVPVWTGMSRGSLKPLGAYLRVAVPISPVAQRSGMGPTAGAQQSSFSFTRTGTSWTFAFTEEVAHFLINDAFDVSAYIRLRTPGPYNAFKAGEEAYEAYIAEFLQKRLPNVNDVIISRKRTSTT